MFAHDFGWIQCVVLPLRVPSGVLSSALCMLTPAGLDTLPPAHAVGFVVKNHHHSASPRGGRCVLCCMNPCMNAIAHAPSWPITIPGLAQAKKELTEASYSMPLAPKPSTVKYHHECNPSMRFHMGLGLHSFSLTAGPCLVIFGTSVFPLVQPLVPKKAVLNRDRQASQNWRTGVQGGGWGGGVGYLYCLA